ncbi:hypothetical protein ACQCSX_19155 [Pseudarthrobacter sp. P1]|uniref:hypothetical protein n=1 Tax=Pseudarthrobacter sp. P1 TaxID=3418418 RepID=UPI003CF6904B
MTTAPQDPKNDNTATPQGKGRPAPRRPRKRGRRVLLAAMAPLLLGALVLTPAAANAATPATPVAEDKETSMTAASGTMAASYTRGFNVHNLTSEPITVSKLELNAGFPGGRPDVGHVLQPGHSDRWELEWLFASNWNSATVSYNLGNGTEARLGMRIDPLIGVPSFPFSSAGGNFELKFSGTDAYILNAPGTVRDIPASLAQAQAQVLKDLCMKSSAATCKFTATKQEKIQGPEHQVGHTYNNPTNMTSRKTVSGQDTVGVSDSLGVGVKVGTTLFGVIDAEISAQYNHEWTKQHTFSESVEADVPPFGSVWLSASEPMIRDTGNFTITMGNTTWHLKDVYFDSPDASGHGSWTLHGPEGTTVVSQQPGSAPVEVR